MIADITSIACDEIYDSKTKKWISNGTAEPSIYITTEQEIDEVQTMMLAFLSNVDEHHILYSNYAAGEYERVLYAAEVLSRSPLYVKKLPDFCLKDIENTIKYGILEWDARYCAFDYIHSTMKILGEVTSKTGISGMREDNVLFMIGVRLKDICNEYGVFIISATQLNGNYIDAEVYDQNLLRGAKSLRR